MGAQGWVIEGLCKLHVIFGFHSDKILTWLQRIATLVGVGDFVKEYLQGRLPHQSTNSTLSNLHVGNLRKKARGYNMKGVLTRMLHQE
jgi:hypothetical protein